MFDDAASADMVVVSQECCRVEMGLMLALLLRLWHGACSARCIASTTASDCQRFGCAAAIAGF